jgi:integrase/recombinase XerC
MTGTALAPVPSFTPVAVDADRLMGAFFGGRNARTLLAYRKDMEDFRQFAGAASVEDAARRLLGGSHGEANATALGYRAAMTERGLKPATVNRRLAALRSLVRLANILGLVPWTLAVENATAQAYRDTRGPGRDGFRALLATAAAQDGRKALRDVALLRLLHDVGLRRGEAVRLDVEDVDLAGSRVFVLGKARVQKEPITLPEPTRAAIAAWLEARGCAAGPLFLNFDRAGKGDGRLSGSAVYAIVRAYGMRAGLAVRPHGLRHLAITTALDVTRGDMRAVQRFSRHRDVRVIAVYDDNRRDLGGEVAALVAGASW